MSVKLPRITQCVLAAAVALGALAAPAGAAVVNVELTAKDRTVTVAPGVRMKAWTFNGQVPGPTIRAREGDTVRVTLRNRDSEHYHSIDFHAAQVAPNVAFADVRPRTSRSFSFVARRPGVFMYHCGTAPVLQHIGMGMYGAIVVDPAAGRSPAQEITLVQSEFYGKVRRGRLRPTLRALQTGRPAYAAFNGRAFRYLAQPIKVRVGKPVRLYVVDAGPTLDSAFHVVGEVFDVAQPDGNPLNDLFGVSTQLVPAGGGAVMELTFDEPGLYPFVNHQFRLADAGAVGKFEAVKGGSP